MAMQLTTDWCCKCVHHLSKAFLKVSFCWYWAILSKSLLFIWCLTDDTKFWDCVCNSEMSQHSSVKQSRPTHKTGVSTTTLPPPTFPKLALPHTSCKRQHNPHAHVKLVTVMEQFYLTYRQVMTHSNSDERQRLKKKDCCHPYLHASWVAF